MDSKKRNDLIIIAVIIAAAALGLMLRRGSAVSGSGAEIVITVDDKEVFRHYSSELELPCKVELEGYQGGYNYFVIDEDGDGRIGIRCTEADCPDKICVHTGRVVLTDQPIVCLPHRITARIVKIS